MSDHEGLVEDLQCYIETLEAQRDALAASLDRIKERARLITDRRQWEGDADPRVPHVLLDRLSEACMDAPETSMVCLIAKKQAEALEDMASEFRGRMKNPDLLCLIDAEYLEKMARHLRRAAKGLEGGES